MARQWHQMDHIQIICTSLQTDNCTSTLPLSFYGPDALPAANNVKALKQQHWIGVLMKWRFNEFAMIMWNLPNNLTCTTMTCLIDICWATLYALVCPLNGTHTTHTQPFYCWSGICPGQPGSAGTRKVKPRRLKPIWIYWSKK